MLINIFFKIKSPFFTHQLIKLCIIYYDKYFKYIPFKEYKKIEINNFNVYLFYIFYFHYLRFTLQMSNNEKIKNKNCFIYLYIILSTNKYMFSINYFHRTRGNHEHL
jgi:hypothetical protein